MLPRPIRGVEEPSDSSRAFRSKSPNRSGLLGKIIVNLLHDSLSV